MDFAYVLDGKKYYIASFPLTAKDAARYIQSHWGIENRLHWSLDVVFHEDACQIHTKNAPENLSILRKIAKAFLQAISLRRKSNIALMDNTTIQSELDKREGMKYNKTG